MKDAVSLVADALSYEWYQDKFWDIVSKLNGKALALVVSERPNDFTEFAIEEHHVDFGKLDASDWIMLLSRCPSIAKSLKYICKDSLWERDDGISNDELAPGVRWLYCVHAGMAHIMGTRGKVVTERDVDLFERESKWSWMTSAMQKIGAITVPSHIDGFPVHSICIDAFEGFDEISKLVVSEGVVEIDSFALYGVFRGPCEVVFPRTLKYIRSNAFSDCHGLRELVIPEGCRSIGDEAFSGCGDLRRIVIPTTMESIGNCAFRGCEKLEEIVMECKYCKFGQGILEGCRSIKKILGLQSRQLEAANFT